MRPLLLAIVALALVPQAAIASTSDLAPSTPWTVSYGTGSCRLSRSFGEGKDAMAILIEQFGDEDAQWITFASHRFHTGRLRNTVRIAWGPTNDLQTVEAYGGAIGQEALPTLALDEIDPFGRPHSRGDEPLAAVGKEKEAALTELRFVDNSANHVRLLTGPMDQPLAAMHKCAHDLLAHWGVDPAARAHYQTRARPSTDPLLWLDSGDYPPAMLVRNESARLHFRLSIDASGAASGCEILQRTDPPGPARTVCDLLMKRARFKPAMDASGKPANDVYVSAVVFRSH